MHRIMRRLVLLAAFVATTTFADGNVDLWTEPDMLLGHAQLADEFFD